MDKMDFLFQCKEQRADETAARIEQMREEHSGRWRQSLKRRNNNIEKNKMENSRRSRPIFFIYLRLCACRVSCLAFLKGKHFLC